MSAEPLPGAAADAGHPGAAHTGHRHSLNFETSGRVHALTVSGSSYDMDLDRMVVRELGAPSGWT
ncbi:MAG: hypothetical protein JWP66_470 [Naasia sp.]|nr:hypothetical protein [Naasia sp.]